MASTRTEPDAGEVKFVVIGLVVLSLSLVLCSPVMAQAKVQGWLHWRGPNQNGTSLEKNLPEEWEPNGTNHLWTKDLMGRGTPVAANGRVYAWGYRGEQADLVEVLMCVDAETGELIWERQFADFLSDIIYDRYSIGAPTIDPDTGNVYLMTSPGLLICFDADTGKTIWQHSMGETYGRLTFPNGRTGAPAIDGDLVVVNTISTNWGAEGPPRNRFYAFDKRSGKQVWSSTPGVGPPYLKDSSFSSPCFAWDNEGRRVFYAGIGSGAVVCVNALTGKPIWRYQVAIGGINCTPVVTNDRVIATHGVENIDSSKKGRLFAINRLAKPSPADAGAPILGKDAELWHQSIRMFTSSPVLVEDRVYQIDHGGELFCLDANDGRIFWHKKLATDQIHASPTWGDGKLYVPMNDGSFYILRPSDGGADVLSKVQLEGNCLGAPAIWDGKVYVFTNQKLYAFGRRGHSQHLPPKPTAEQKPTPGKAVALQILPSEVLLRPGQKVDFEIRKIDARGIVVGKASRPRWEKYIPPTAKVKARMDADFNEAGELVARPDARPSAGAFKATAEGLFGTIRGRVLPELPTGEDFESFELTHTAADGGRFAYPPLPWIGARFKWEVREQDGSKVFAKTLDRLILQRAFTYIGDANQSNYTLRADVMTDGNRRLKGEVGLINQRYIIVLKGNHRQIEINSNQERIKHAVRFHVLPKVWYRMKTRVDVEPDESGWVRGKVWKRDAPEPAEWTIEFKHSHVHKQGAPGVFGFSPQNKFRVFVDNIVITPND